MFALSSFLSEVMGKSWVPLANILGRIVKGIAQISGTPLFHVRIAILELAGLVSGWRHAGIGQQLVRGVKPSEVADLI